MSVAAERQNAAPTQGPNILLFWLGGGASICLLGAGGLMWWRYGPAVFVDTVLAGLAWCF